MMLTIIMSFLPSFLLDAAAAEAVATSTTTSHGDSEPCIVAQQPRLEREEDDDGDEAMLRRPPGSVQQQPPAVQPQRITATTTTSLTMPPPKPLQPPLGVTGIMCHEGQATLRRGTVCYRIFRPRYLTYHQSSYQPPTANRTFLVPLPPPPLIVLQGGPGMPCPYLFPLAHVVTDRAIVFYDPLGCGSSALVVNNNNCSDSSSDCFALANMIQDLTELIQDHWKLSRFHLYGHSFGGILAFEYLLQQQQSTTLNQVAVCQSVTLASTPTSTELVESESLRLLRQVQEDHQQQPSSDSSRLLELFRHQHECRIQPPPLAILDACWHAANLLKRQQYQHLRQRQQEQETATDSTDTSTDPNMNAPTKPSPPSIPTAMYSYTVPSDDTKASVERGLPPALVVWGEHDFVTERCVEHWNDYNFLSIQMTLLANCSHYGMWEEETLYGNVLSTFLQDHDEDAGAIELKQRQEPASSPRRYDSPIVKGAK
jgi:pimeloyl-ACP methyl ester carboxylesterase